MFQVQIYTASTGSEISWDETYQQRLEQETARAVLSNNEWNWLSKDELRSRRIEEWLQSCVPIFKTGNILEQKTGGIEGDSNKIRIS